MANQQLRVFDAGMTNVELLVLLNQFPLLSARNNLSLTLSSVAKI